jgi:hypothetical protein
VREARKAFFFEKKKQKTFFHLLLQQYARGADVTGSIDKSSLVLSFKKERLTSLPAS